MPWEIDEFLILARKLKKSYYYLDENNEYTFYVCLNLSSAIIDWNKSKLDKEFFIDKFNSILKILENSYNIEWEIYDDDNPVGHLDVEKELFKRHKEYDGILALASDIHFHETLLKDMFSIFESTSEEFKIITPQMHRLWDASWDEVVNEYCKSYNYENHDQIDVYDAEWITECNLNNISMYKISQNKWAGWCDLRSSKLIKWFSPPKSWTGYGPYDTYLMILLANYKHINPSFDFQQYAIENQVIGKVSNHNFKDFYKKYLVFKNIKQTNRQTYEKQINKIIEIHLKKIKNLALK